MSAHRIFQFASLLIATLALTATARADETLYTDGPVSGANWGFQIDSSFQVEDSFTLTTASTLTGVTYGNILATGNTGTSVEWAIVGSEGSQTPVCPGCSGTATLTPDGMFSVIVPPGVEVIGVNQEFALPDVALSAGNYWLELQHEVYTGNGGTLWDVNGGPSGSWANGVGDTTGSNCALSSGPGTCANSFTIFGTTSDASPSTTPEPSSLALLGSGLTLLAAQIRRRYHLHPPAPFVGA